MKQAHTLRTAVICLLCLTLAVFVAGKGLERYYRGAYPYPYQDLIEQAARENDLPPALVLAVMRTESSFRPDVVSSVGARGLMQLTEETFDWVKSRTEPQAETTYEDMYQPEQAISYGCALLRLLIDEFGSLENALCAYHAGWGTVKGWLRDPEFSTDGQVTHIPYGDTRAYVKKVLETKNIYESLYFKEAAAT